MGQWGDALKFAMMSDGRTAYQIGKAAGVDPSQVSRFLRGDVSFSLEAAERLGLVLGLKVEGTGEVGQTAFEVKPAKVDPPSSTPSSVSDVRKAEFEQQRLKKLRRKGK